MMTDKKPVNRPELAKKRFLRSMNCSQAVVETYAPSLGMTIEQARRVSAAFAGGMGIGSECGAVTGALMIIGLKYGKISDHDPHANKKMSSCVTMFINEFRACHKHLSCSGLLECEMGTPDGISSAARRGYFTSRCPEFVESAAKILDRILTKEIL
jgi:C_GCAxxG_C_C family probable redox protein